MEQRELVSKISDTRPRFNPVFFERDEDAIIHELMNVIKSCERENQYFTIKVSGYRVVDDYDEINQILYNYYETTSKNKMKNKKRDNQYEFINLNESYIRLLIVDYYVKDRKDEDHIEVVIAIPRIIDKYYFLINGIMRSTLFQIVDGSTYNNGTSTSKTPSITLKIVFMATRVTRYYNTLKTTEGEELRLTHYYSRIFNKSVPGDLYIFAKYGYFGGIDFLGLRDAITVTPEDPMDKSLYTFQVSEGIYVNSPKEIMNRNALVQSVVTTLCTTLVPGMKYSMVFDDLFWVRVLGAEFTGNAKERLTAIMDPEDDSVTDTLEKGYSILDSFESIYDITTRESIKLPESEKATTYHVLRWIMREFNALRLKDNLDISCKKIRFAEYIAAIYAFKIAKGIYRVSDLNKKATIVNIRKAIRTDPNFLLNAISKSKMVSYRNMVTDMDALQALKFTYKGVSGLGEGNNNSIPDIYRSIHPSHVGRVDLDSSSDGNPGITGTICPFAENYDGFFTEYEEPNSWQQEFFEVMDNYRSALGLRDALIFETQVLNTDNSAALSRVTETISHMQQIIKPVINSDDGEIVKLEVQL